MTPSNTPHPYDALTPEVVLDAVESFGVRCDGRILALNSYENRVYQIGIEDSAPLIAKFYRPERWSDAAILEEHAFSLELSEQEIPVVAPLRNEHGETLFNHDNFRFALFPRYGGHAPEFEDPEHLRVIGRFLGRIHGVGGTKQFKHRPRLNVQRFGWESIATLEASPHVPRETCKTYVAIARACLERIESLPVTLNDVRMLRIHGDCHQGNILWRDDRAHFVDLDDSLTGPAIQDFWMLLCGARDEMMRQLDHLLAGYEMFQLFDPREIALIEPLRTLRLIHYNAWLARRWDDPAFPPTFPWFTSPGYWNQQIAILQEQLAQMSDAPPAVEEDFEWD